MKNRSFFAIVVFAIFTIPLNSGCHGSHNSSSPEHSPSVTRTSDQDSQASSQPNAQDMYKTLPGPGEKINIGQNYYFTYGFTKPPKLGTSIMKVEIFTRGGQKDTTLVVKGDVDMPSMRGAHSMGNKDFSISEKGDYLLPVSLVMPGDWEFRFSFVKDGSTLLRGAYLFDL
jgi:hypothetical protein